MVTQASRHTASAIISPEINGIDFSKLELSAKSLAGKDSGNLGESTELWCYQIVRTKTNPAPVSLERRAGAGHTKDHGI